MAFISGRAKNFEELTESVIQYTTNKTIHGNKAWEVVRNDPWPRGTILKCGGLKGDDVFYLGLMSLDIIKGKTYAEWVMQKDIIGSHFVWARSGLGNVTPFTVSGNTVRIVPMSRTEDPPEPPKISYHFFSPEIFSHSAKVLWLGVFKQYCPELDWHEQPGGIDFRDVPLMPVQYLYSNADGGNSTTRSNWTPPMFPGGGYPAISMDIGGPITGEFDYYLVKNKHGLTVAINNYNAEAAGRWETAYAGFFAPYADYEYPFPAVVVGGTSGVAMKGESRLSGSDAVNPYPCLGLKLDYHQNNWSLIHGVASFACAGMDHVECPTQVMAMLPDGSWKSFANYVQGAEARLVPSEYSTYVNYGYPNTRPVRPQNIKSFIRPTERDLLEYYGTYVKNEDRSKRKSAYKFEPLELVEDKNVDGLHILGRIPNFFHVTRPVDQYGEILIDDIAYLVLPNVWQDRRFHLPYYVYYKYEYEFDADILLDEDRANEKELRQYKDLMNIVIRLEE